MTNNMVVIGRIINLYCNPVFIRKGFAHPKTGNICQENKWYYPEMTFGVRNIDNIERKTKYVVGCIIEGEDLVEYKRKLSDHKPVCVKGVLNKKGLLEVDTIENL